MIAERLLHCRFRTYTNQPRIGTPQFAGVGNNQWNRAANPSGLTGDNAIAYSAARAVARDLLYGTTDYDAADPTSGGTYFYSVNPPPPATPQPPPPEAPPAGFFRNSINSGRLGETYRAGQFRFLRDTQPRVRWQASPTASPLPTRTAEPTL